MADDCCKVKVVYPKRGKRDHKNCSGQSKKGSKEKCGKSCKKKCCLDTQGLCPSVSYVTCGNKIDACTQFSLVTSNGGTGVTGGSNGNPVFILEQGACVGQVKYIKNATLNTITLNMSGLASTGSLNIQSTFIAILLWDGAIWNILSNAAPTTGAT